MVIAAYFTLETYQDDGWSGVLLILGLVAVGYLLILAMVGLAFRRK